MGHKHSKPKKLFALDKKEKTIEEKNNYKMSEDNITKSSFEFI